LRCKSDYAEIAAAEMQPTRNKISETTFDAAEPSLSQGRLSAIAKGLRTRGHSSAKLSTDSQRQCPHFNDDVRM
jgi:hypothetical protein